MPLADYAHWNEEAPRVWWEEEGKHADEPRDYDDLDGATGAADAFAEGLAEYDDEQLLTLLDDDEYLGRWPKAKPLIEWEIRDRGLSS